MRASDLSELAAFAAVARHRSFRRAGEERGVTASAISHAVSNLEARVGIRLLNRTTRSVSLTDAGTMLVARLSSAFDDIGTAMDGLNRFRDTPFGKVRINAPTSIATVVLGPLLGPLMRANPHLALEIVTTDRLVDIVDEGFDAGIRLGESLREGMTAIRIRPRLRLVVVGSPGYFRDRPAPTSPEELAAHVCLQNLYPSGVRYAWSFEKDGRTMEFQPAGPFASDDHGLLLEAALAGVGLAYVWDHRAEAPLRDGRLVRCLDAWCVPDDSLYLYYPTRKYISAGLRAVIEMMRA
ncbi:MAG: LysR substrate-binding domain-containing protein [Microvirga sp.]